MIPNWNIVGAPAPKRGRLGPNGHAPRAQIGHEKNTSSSSGQIMSPDTPWDCHIFRSVGVVLGGQWGSMYGSPMECLGMIVNQESHVAQGAGSPERRKEGGRRCPERHVTSAAGGDEQNPTPCDSVNCTLPFRRQVLRSQPFRPNWFKSGCA